MAITFHSEQDDTLDDGDGRSTHTIFPLRGIVTTRGGETKANSKYLDPHQKVACVDGNRDPCGEWERMGTEASAWQSDQSQVSVTGTVRSAEICVVQPKKKRRSVAARIITSLLCVRVCVPVGGDGAERVHLLSSVYARTTRSSAPTDSKFHQKTSDPVTGFASVAACIGQERDEYSRLHLETGFFAIIVQNSFIFTHLFAGVVPLSSDFSRVAARCSLLLKMLRHEYVFNFAVESGISLMRVDRKLAQSPCLQTMVMVSHTRNLGRLLQNHHLLLRQW